MEVPAALITGIVALITSGVTAATTFVAARRRAAVERDLAERRAAVDEKLKALEGQIAEQRVRLENRTLFAAEDAARALMNHPDWKSRRFKILKWRLGGFDDDALRQILVRAGAIRLRGADGTERWGLIERNPDTLTGHEPPAAEEEREISE